LIIENPNLEYYKIINDEKIKIHNDFAIHCVFICHRVNNYKDLDNIDPSFGVEIDIRDNFFSKELMLVHDPFEIGNSLDSFLSKYKHNTLILNIKSEQTEIKCLEYLNRYKISNYFFLDSSFPMIYKLSQKYNNKNISARFSEFECIENLERIQSMIEWIWIDCFTRFPIDSTNNERIKGLGKKCCIVSPELQGQFEKIHDYRQLLIDLHFTPDAICCKEKNIIFWL
jgi:hypothetical protein